MTKKNNLVYLLITLSMVFWGMSFVWVKIAFKYINPITLVFFRLVVSSSLLFILGKMFHLIQNNLDRKSLLSLMLLAFFEPFLYFLGESFGLQLVSPTIGSIIIATIPVITPVFSYIIAKEKISMQGIIGIFVSFAGVLLIVFNKNFEIIYSIKGLILMFFAVFSAIGYMITAKFVAQKVRPLTMVVYQNLFGSLYFFPLFLIIDLKTLNIGMINIELITNLLLLALLPSTFSFIFYNLAIKEIGINKSNIFTNFIPVVTAIASFFILKEGFDTRKILAITLVLLGVLISQIKRKQRVTVIPEY